MMMKTHLILLLLALTVSASIAQSDTSGWVRYPTPTTEPLGTITLQGDTIWIGPEMAKSTNGGLSWDSLTNLPASGGIYFVNDTLGFIYPGGQTIWRTADGGRTWDSVWSANYTVQHLVFTTADSGWGIGHAEVIRTTDAGRTWRKRNIGGVYCLAFADSKHGYLMGEVSDFPPRGHAAFLARTSDGGETWSSVFTGLPRDVWGVAARPDGRLVAVGTQGLIGVSTDFGTTWDTVAGFFGQEGFFDVTFADSSNVTAIGTTGLIAHSTDAGRTWTHQTCECDLFLLDVQFTDSLHGYIVGDSGLFLKTNNGGRSWASELRTPLAVPPFVFPQPSIDHASVTYSLPEADRITLRLFDPLGRIAAFVCPNLQQTGENQFTISTSALASGTYAYTLTSQRYHAAGRIVVQH